MAREPKYGNTRVKSHDGYSFDSKLEAALYDYLQFLVRKGEISDLKVKPNIFLTDARVRMIPDFCAYERSVGAISYYEAKGFVTPEWLLKRKLWTVYGPGVLHIYTGHYKKLIGPETIVPRPAHR